MTALPAYVLERRLESLRNILAFDVDDVNFDEPIFFNKNDEFAVMPTGEL